MENMPSQPSYPTDLNEVEWEIVEKILGESPKLGRPPRFERRDCAQRCGRIPGKTGRFDYDYEFRASRPKSCQALETSRHRAGPE